MRKIILIITVLTLIFSILSTGILVIVTGQNSTATTVSGE